MSLTLEKTLKLSQKEPASVAARSRLIKTLSYLVLGTFAIFYASGRCSCWSTRP